MQLRRGIPWRNKEGIHTGWIVANSMFLGFVLVITTWNPTGHSYLHWITTSIANETFTEQAMLKTAVGVLLAGSWLAVIVVALHRLKWKTVLTLATAIVAMYAFLQWAIGFADSVWLMAWLVLVAVSIYIGWLISHWERTKMARRMQNYR